ncbi:hypothetical protein [Bacillus thuringiensis]|uniref:hypothetical protein n=1 Tax=Bacillus thuringiensis TaxID=1428 RepID=UPI003F6BBCEE
MSLHYPNHSITYSTGVLTREHATVSAVVNIVNLDAHYEHPISIEVWDWSNYSNPVKLPVLIGENTEAIFPYPLAGNHLAVFYADLNESVNLYEIRISYRKHANVVANCFGRSLPPYTSQQGNTVYHKQLVKIHESITFPYYQS